jgi:hypothetical protein
MEQNEFDEQLKEYTKQYSKSRQRDYYFNSKTGESLWTLDEVKEKIKKNLTKKDIKSSKACNEQPTTSKCSNLYQESVVQMTVDEDDYQCDPMDIEIVENVSHLGFFLIFVLI